MSQINHFLSSAGTDRTSLARLLLRRSFGYVILLMILEGLTGAEITQRFISPDKTYNAVTSHKQVKLSVAAHALGLFLPAYLILAIGLL